MDKPETIPASPGRLHRLKLYYEKNERNLAIASFVGGFLFDILTTGRIDSWLLIGQQALYLVVITAALLQMLFEEGKPQPDDLGVNSYIVKPLDFAQFANVTRNAALYWLLFNRPAPKVDRTS